jgi:amidohydrolase
MDKTNGRKSIWYLALVMAVATLLVATTSFADPGKIIAAIDAANPACKLVSEKIFEFKELGQQEFKSSALLIEELRKLGFKVTGDLKVPADLVKDGIAKTAFRAELQGKGPGPTITIMLEYDALKNGHACGHNLIATSGLLAAAGLAQVMKDTPGRLLVIGTPDEERGSLGGGKIALLEGGHFEGSDVVFITHPADRWNTDMRSLAMKRATFIFKGKASHAAASPHKGISALDAVVLTFNATDMLREHVREDVRIHGIIKKGGDLVNVVPELAEAEFAVRALDTGTMEETYHKVVNCARAAELATGAKLEFKEPRTALKAAIKIPALTKAVLDHAKALGAPEAGIQSSTESGSSDLGNVGHAYPTVELKFKIGKEGTAGHSDDFREAAASKEGWSATVIAGKALALTAYDLLTHPEKVKAIQDKFKELKAKEGK